MFISQVSDNEFHNLSTAGKYKLERIDLSAARMRKEFPSSQFNHAFLCVPLKKDTIWLECTSQHVPCGFLGNFTDDRDVLLITEEGGKVVHTPSYTSLNNQQIRKAEVTLANDNHGKAVITSEYNGIFYSDLLPVLLGDDHHKKKIMYNRIDIPSFDLIKYEHKEIRKQVPCIEETLEIQLNNYSSLMGSYVLLPLNLLTKINPLPRNKDERISDIYVEREYLKIDTIKYIIPSNHSVKDLPDNNTIKSDFGEYKYKVNHSGSDIYYIRFLKMNKGIYDKKRYQEFYDFFEQISMLDNAKAILVKNTAN